MKSTRCVNNQSAAGQPDAGIAFPSTCGRYLPSHTGFLPSANARGPSSASSLS
ncbi:Uncharacterised protein [Bordetella pertussis]|nr:Uncharacterised protein [Bordetella pertussis]CFV97722.1 Uncharacterised protein [Bordetella pertussis]CFW30186.1 Uncharacterised protein [Bordetella pertussis]